MKLALSIQSIKSSLGKNKSGAEITLADTEQPQCLCPFSFYVGDVPAFEAEHGVKLVDLRYKTVAVEVTHMASPNLGAGIKLEGNLIPQVNGKK